MNTFYKGRTNQHLTWVMVDATDFASPESAVSAATTIKIYGKLRGATGVNFVSSGAGSLTNDITHVGASATGIYTIALAKADLSDASAAWYDQYIITLSATGCARQTLVVDGGIDASAISAYQSRLSDLASYLVAMSGMLSDAHSAAILAASNASEAQSNILLVQSRLSDFNSAYASDISDVLSQLLVIQSMSSDAHSAAILAASTASEAQSNILLVQSRLSDFNSVYTSDISDIRSMLTALSDAVSDAHSDLGSKIGGITASVSASDISDIASAVWAHTVGTRVDSRVLVVQSLASDAHSAAVVAQALSASDISDLRSAIAAGPAATITASDISDIASAVWAAKYTAHSAASSFGSLMSDIYSRVLLNQSRISDIQSALSDAHSDLGSKIGAITATVSASDISDIASAVRATLASDLSDILSAAVQTNSRVILVQSRLSDFNSVYTSDISDLKSQLTVIQSMASDAHSAALATQSSASDIYSLLSDVSSDLTVMSGVLSDTYSAVTAAIGASDLSDIASAVWARAGADPTTVPAVTAGMGAKLDWLTALSRNKITQNSAVQSLRNDADAADIASAAVSDDGTTFTRNEWA